MTVVSFEGIIENGQIKLPEGLPLPDYTKVYVVVPGLVQRTALNWMSPRLAHTEQAEDFNKVIVPNAL